MRALLCTRCCWLFGSLSSSQGHAGVIRVLSCLAASGQQRAALRAAGANAVLSRLIYGSADHAVQVQPHPTSAVAVP